MKEHFFQEKGVNQYYRLSNKAITDLQSVENGHPRILSNLEIAKARNSKYVRATVSMRDEIAVGDRLYIEGRCLEILEIVSKKPHALRETPDCFVYELELEVIPPLD